MNAYYQDYYWKNGLPYGLKATEPLLAKALALTYKIIIDPYYKRISIEQYNLGEFQNAVYDSALLDFRRLKPADQTAWHREIISENDSQTVCLIRNQEDRVVLIETQHFQQNLCTECRLSSPQGILVSIHKMFYTKMQAFFNGVILFDQNDHPVIYKNYEIDENGEFTNLIEEQWNFEAGNPVPKPIEKLI